MYLFGFGPFLRLMHAKAGAFVLRICIKCYCCATFFRPAINYILAVRISIIYERVKHDTRSNNYTHRSAHTVILDRGERGRAFFPSHSTFPCIVTASLKVPELGWFSFVRVKWGLSTFSGWKVQVLKCSFHHMSVRFCGFYYMTITTITDICEPRLLKKFNRNESEIALWVAYNRYVDRHNSQRLGECVVRVTNIKSHVDYDYTMSYFVCDKQKK